MAPAGVVHRAEPGAADGAVNARPRSLLGKRLIVPGARRGAGLLARDDAFWRHQPGASPAWRHARRRSAARSRGLAHAGGVNGSRWASMAACTSLAKSGSSVGA